MYRRHFTAMLLAGLVASATSFTASTASAQGEWKRLGTATVNGTLDKDTITVGASAGAFTAIQMKVEGASLELKELKVTFTDNTTFLAPAKMVFNAGQSTRSIDLPGNAREIKQIDLTYSNLAGGANARVEVLGKTAPPPAQWKKLGERTVNGKLDKDTIVVGADDGFFTAIQVKVENSSLDMRDIKVNFGNGSSFSPDTRVRFDANTKSRVIDLPGEKRIIKSVEFKYSNVPGGGNARVELWGRR